MSNYIKIAGRVNGIPFEETLMLPDMSGLTGRMSVYGIIQPRLYALCEQISRSLPYAPAAVISVPYEPECLPESKYRPEHQEDDGDACGG